MNTTGHIPPVATVPLSAAGTGRNSVAGNGSGLTLDVVRSFDDGGITKSEWNSLVDLCDATVYSTWEWQSLWWKHLGSLRRGRVLNIMVFRREGGVVGIAPFFIDEPGISRRSMLRFIGSGDAFNMTGGMFLDDGPSDYLDVIARSADCQSIAAEIAGYLQRNRETIDGCEMVNIRPGGTGSACLIREMGRLGFTVETSPGDICPFIVVDSDTPEFIGRQGSSLRRRLNQAFRLLGDGTTTYAENDPGEWDAFFHALVEMHQRRWNGAGFPGLFHDGASAQFQKAVAESFMKNGWLWFGSLHEGGQRGGRCIAARMGFSFRGRMYDYLSGFDESSTAARHRPGMGLLLAMHRAARGAGAVVLDMLRGDEKYKFELTSCSVRLLNVRILQPDPEGSPGHLNRRMAAVGRMARFMMDRELRLLEVQRRQHGLTAGLFKYFSFRVFRLRKKMSVDGNAIPGDEIQRDNA